MRTSKAVSTVSYNSIEFLKQKLDELMNEGVIAFYAFIKHNAEEDEINDHIHLFIEPKCMIETGLIHERLLEHDLKYPDKPLGCISFKSSEFFLWYMYACHDKIYLMCKGQTRKHHYQRKDFITSHPELFED